MISSEARSLMTKATELFLGYFAETSFKRFAGGKKRTLEYNSLRECVRRCPEQFEFLEDDFPDMVRSAGGNGGQLELG